MKSKQATPFTPPGCTTKLLSLLIFYFSVTVFYSATDIPSKGGPGQKNGQGTLESRIQSNGMRSSANNASTTLTAAQSHPFIFTAPASSPSKSPCCAKEYSLY
jgi:hypothetical protein